MSENKPILVTGSAGFIGFHLASRLLREGQFIVGLDDLNSYYDTTLKQARLAQLQNHPNFKFIRQDIADDKEMEAIFQKHSFGIVLHMAAQVGVRYSLTNPRAYIHSNIRGFMNILECCRHTRVRHLIYASSSSVYGANRKIPFSVCDPVPHPVSLYGATKRANELMAYSYADTYGLFSTGLRFFTVYGPWGRPDMALFLFTKAILEGKPIDVFNYGRMQRDFTYIDDIVEGVLRIIDAVPKKVAVSGEEMSDSADKSIPYRLYNLGYGKPVELNRIIEMLEDCLDRKTEKRMLALQPGDMQSTYADMADFRNEFNFQPEIQIEDGVRKFVTWFRSYYKI